MVKVSLKSVQPPFLENRFKFQALPKFFDSICHFEQHSKSKAGPKQARKWCRNVNKNKNNEIFVSFIFFRVRILHSPELYIFIYERRHYFGKMHIS